MKHPSGDLLLTCGSERRQQQINNEKVNYVLKSLLILIVHSDVNNAGKDIFKAFILTFTLMMAW